MTIGATLTTSFLATLARPSTWPLALVAFLLRGGLVVVLAPIVVMPSVVGVANAVGPSLTTFVFAGVTPAILATGLAIAVGALVWLLVGGLVAAVAEAELIRIVATDDDVVAAVRETRAAVRETRAAVADPAAPAASSAGAAAPAAAASRRRVAGRTGPLRILAVQLLAQAPLVLAVTWGGARVVAVTYRELTLPSDVTVPIVVRVLGRVPETIVLIVLAWWLGQVVGSVAARRVVLRGTGVARSLASAAAWLVRNPARGVVLELVPTAVAIAVLGPCVAASSAAWEAVRASIATVAGPFDTVVHVVLFVALWSGGLVLVSMVAAWRAAVWTVDAAGTFGVPRPAERGTGPDAVGLAR